MPEAIKNITIVDSPFQPAMESAFGIVLMVRSPRSTRSVTVMVNPAAADYQAHPVDTPQVQVRQSSVMQYTGETLELFFDFDGEPIHRIEVAGQPYDLRLMNIGRVSQDGQEFPSYEFMITQL